MAGEFLLATQFAAAGLMFILAGWLLWLRFNNPVNRAFALFLVVHGLRLVAFRLQEISGNPLYWEGVAGYFLLAVVPTLAYFLVVYAGPPRLVGSPWARWAVLGAGLALELVYALDHCLLRCPGPSGLRTIGPLGVLGYSYAPAYAVVGLVLALQFARASEGRRRRAAFLVSVAFVLNAVLDAAVVVGLVAQAGLAGALGFFEPSVWPAVAFAITLAALAPAAAAFALYARSTHEAAERASFARAGYAGALAALTGVFVGWGPALPGEYATLGPAVVGLWRLVLPALVVYAIVRHQLFDLDVKVKWTIRQSTVAAVFIGVFFMVSESAQIVFAESIGPYLGVLAAGLLLFALHPLQGAAERVARRAMPHVPDQRGLSDPQRAQAFRIAVEMALTDGVMTRVEERSLARLAAQLGLDPERALLLREEVEARLARERGPPASPAGSLP